MTTHPDNFTSKTATVWALADILRGAFKPAEYGRVILPFMVLRRIDCAIEANRAETLATFIRLEAVTKPEGLEVMLMDTSGYPFYNLSNFNFKSLTEDPDNLEANLKAYLDGFSRDVKDIVDNFKLMDSIRKLAKNNLLFAIIEKFSTLDLHPESVSNTDMSYIFEELLRKFSEMTNETAGEHYTPRSVVNLATRLAIAEDPSLASRVNQVISIYDPTCGTGGMILSGEEYIVKNIDASAGLIELFGQELNEESYAIAKADLLIKGHDASHIAQGDTLTNDKFPNNSFTYSLANPPYGTSWTAQESRVKAEAENEGYAGRFGAGTPSVSDGSLLFVQHIISKMNPLGARAAIVLNSSPLTNGDAGSGESEIRKWILEQDLLDTVVALPGDMFYNTGIGTYIWLLDNNKPKKRAGKVQFINAKGMYAKMRKALGSKRNEIEPEHIDAITKLYRDFKENKESKIIPVSEFLFQKVTVERPKRDDKGEVVLDKKGKVAPEASLRDTERVPFGEDIEAYLTREVLPYAPDAYVDASKTKVGAQIPFDQYFYEYQALPTTESLEVTIKEKTAKIQSMLSDLLGK